MKTIPISAIAPADREGAVRIDVNGDVATIYYADDPQPQTDPLAGIRQAQIAAINAERDRREQSSFPYMGKRIDSDPVSVQRISVAAATAQMALAQGVPFSLEWTCADNSLLPLDAAGVLGMMQALGAYGLSLHMHARALKDAVNASDDPASIDTSSGWPE
jgi:hypothetical protein